MQKLLSKNVPLPPVETFLEGTTLLIDKDLGWTSFDVVNKIRYKLCRHFDLKKLKVGHAGTLDPLATGLLLLCTGKSTRDIDQLQSLEKEYTGTITFGGTTASLDLEKPVSEIFPTEHLTDALVQAALPQFLGEIEQIPPMFSAIKIGGQRLYKNARTGETVQVDPRRIQIFDLEIGPLRRVPGETISDLTQLPEPKRLNEKGPPLFQHFDLPGGLQADFRVRCSKGTYIRTLAADLGTALGTGAYLSALRRTQTGGFSVADAWLVADFVAQLA